MLRVLIVDDEPSNRLLLSQILHHGGYSTSEAADGAEALRLLTTAGADIVILDLNMPRMSGPVFIKNVRATAALRELKIVLYTATPENRAIRDFMELFAIRHLIPKPSDPAQVLQIIERVASDAVSRG